jgi:hypothetical protein
VQSAGHEGKVYALEIMRFHPIVSQSSMFPCCRTSCSSMPVISRSIDLLVSTCLLPIRSSKTNGGSTILKELFKMNTALQQAP